MHRLQVERLQPYMKASCTWHLLLSACKAQHKDLRCHKSQALFRLVHRNLQRYIHYNSRWEAHVASQKLEAKHSAEIREKIAELEDNGTELKDYTWLSQVPEAGIAPVTSVHLLPGPCCSAATVLVAVSGHISTGRSWEGKHCGCSVLVTKLAGRHSLCNL